MGRKRMHLLNLLRLAAILLVINSHCDPLYPIPALATGGALGNALFFILSGYLLKLDGSFFGHMGRRIARLYPGMIIMLTADVLRGGTKIPSLKEALLNYVWPTAFWFVGAIVLFDILAFGLSKLRFQEHFGRFSLFMAVLYFAAYFLIVDKSVWSVEEPGLRNPAQWFKLIYYFYIYALGFCLSSGPKKTTRMQPKTLLILALAFAAGSVGIKGLFVRRPELLAFQFLPQLMGIAFSLLALLWALAGEERYLEITPVGFRKTVDMLANLSLEVYLTQFMAIDLCKGLAFPLNMVLMLAGTFGAAYPLWKIDRWAQKALCGLFFHESKGGTAA